MPVPEHMREQMREKANTAPDYRNRFDVADAYEFMDFGYSLAIKEREWIDVNDRLPEKGQAVLFIINAPSDHNHGRVLGGKYSHSNDFSVPGIGYDASYWMPMDFLPSPPNKD